MAWLRGAHDGRSGTGDDKLGSKELRSLLHHLVVDSARLLVQAVWHRLEEDRRRRDFLLGGEKAVSQVTAVRQVEAHDPAMRLHDAGVDGKIGGRSKKIISKILI